VRTKPQISNPSKRPTLKDIAQDLGITTMTVSKSLRGVGRISEKMRRLVHNKAEELGYLSPRDRLFPPFVRAFGSLDHRLRLLCPTIGFLQRGETVPYRNDMMIGLERALGKMDGAIEVKSFASLGEMQEFLSVERFHGLALTEPFPSRWIETVGRQCPIVYTIGHDFQDGVDSVYFNEARAAATIVNQLRELGHRQIGWLGILDRNAPFHISDEEFSQDIAADWLSRSGHGTRFASWLYLARQHPDPAVWPVSLFERDWRTCTLAEAVRRGSRALFHGQPRPTAVVCMSNSIARELVQQLEEDGLRVPDDLSVVSYGVEEMGMTDQGRQLSGVVMSMDRVGSLVPEVIQRRLAYPEGLPISIQLDAAWLPGETIRSLLA
jgi:LacI family transcriptional regulator